MIPFSDLPSKWSLLEQLDLASTNAEEKTRLEAVFDEVPSPDCSVSSADVFFTDDTCILSPLSESDDSGVSSCNSPLGNCSVEELESSAWFSNQVVNDADLPVTIPEVSNQNEFRNLFENLQETALNAQQMQDINPAIGFGITEMCQFDGAVVPNNDVIDVPSVPVHVPIPADHSTFELETKEEVETSEVAFIEHTALPPVLVKESEQSIPVEIVPCPDPCWKSNQRLLVIRGDQFIAKPLQPKMKNCHMQTDMIDSVRSSPYPKTKPAKKKSPEQKERKRCQNRNAASKYRNKKKDELGELFEEAQKLEETNKNLSDKVTSLTAEIDYLKGLMLDVIKAKLARSNSPSN